MLNQMKNEGMRDKYESIGRNYLTMLLEEWQNRYSNTTITDITESKDPYSPYDMTATVNGKVQYIELKSRTNKYSYNKVIDKGLLLRAHKNDGSNTLFACVFPDDRIICITTPELIKDLKPLKTKVKHKYTVDEDSKEDIQENYLIPKDRFYIYKVFPYQIISKPEKR